MIELIQEFVNVWPMISAYLFIGVLFSFSAEVFREKYDKALDLSAEVLMKKVNKSEVRIKLKDKPRESPAFLITVKDLVRRTFVNASLWPMFFSMLIIALKNQECP